MAGMHWIFWPFLGLTAAQIARHIILFDPNNKALCGQFFCECPIFSTLVALAFAFGGYYKMKADKKKLKTEEN